LGKKKFGQKLRFPKKVNKKRRELRKGIRTKEEIWLKRNNN